MMSWLGVRVPWCREGASVLFTGIGFGDSLGRFLHVFLGTASRLYVAQRAGNCDLVRFDIAAKRIRDAMLRASLS